MATSTVDLLRQTLAAQAAVAPQYADLQPYLTRYVYNPFQTKRLSFQKRKQFGLPDGLRHDVIERITKFDEKIIDDNAVARVPQDAYGGYVWTGYGTSEMKPYDRRPADVVAGLLRAVNPSHTSSGAEDNGIIEVTTMRGLDDLQMYVDLQDVLLPQQFPTIRAKIAHLEAVTHRDAKYLAVRDELLEATLTAFTWGRVMYGRMQGAIELFGRTGRDGKKELSRFDRALCRWLEMPEPRLHSMLDVPQGQAQAGQSLPPFVICEDCGNMINLLPDGSLPRKGCIACGWNPNATNPAAEFDAAVPGTPIKTFDEMQAELNAKRIK